MSVNKKIIETEAVVPEYDFGVTTYTGNGSTNSITTGMQPDLVFLRNADTTSAYATGVFDSTRGATKFLNANSTAAESTDATSLTSFDSDGFTLGSGGDFNANGTTFNSFSLKANGGTTSSNTDGSITSTVQANANAGFSISKWSGNGSAATIGHGLSATPEMIITKRLTGTSPWYTYNAYLNGGANPAYYFVNLNTRNGETYNGSSGGSLFNSTPPTSTIFNIGTSLSGSGDDYIAYCFHSVSGYSKLGTYNGNASTNAITVGFLPKFLMVKKSSGFGTWYFWLASGMTEQSYGYSGNSGMAISSTGTLPSVEFRSDNGGQFVLSGSDFNVNASGATFIYWCVGGDKTNLS